MPQALLTRLLLTKAFGQVRPWGRVAVGLEGGVRYTGRTRVAEGLKGLALGEDLEQILRGQVSSLDQSPSF